MRLIDPVDVILSLIILWLVALSISNCLIIKAEREFLKFTDFVIDDNLKNVVQSGGNTYYIVDMGKVTIPQDVGGTNLWSPIYVDGKDLPALADWRRKMSIMVKEYDEMDITGKQLVAQAEGFFTRKLAETQKRKEEKK